MISTMTQYQLVNGNLDRSMRVVAADPIVERETEYYLENIGDVKTIDEFLEDDRLFSYAMKAAGLSDMTYAKAFMRKVLEEGTDDRNAFANRLADERYKDFAKTFNFVRYGEAATSFERAGQGVVDKYHRQTLEENEGNTNDGVRLALYFTRKAPDISNVYEILADKALAQVVYAALGLPDSFATANIDKQAAYIENNIDLADFQDPEKLDKFMQRFSAMYDMKNGLPLATSPALQLISSANSTVAIGQDLLTSIQTLKLGGF
ncbi:DUF1217 domain-containing protein [Breoghania sp.]|uniref:DUF1217 domain-containing protein n=1 Tax=Breoghania sp. TaxID=2065378 RepID=UPI002AAAB821|nr:DUF1217 domain-containing protein [Breoghania sp.]